MVGRVGGGHTYTVQVKLIEKTILIRLKVLLFSVGTPELLTLFQLYWEIYELDAIQIIPARNYRKDTVCPK